MFTTFMQNEIQKGTLNPGSKMLWLEFPIKKTIPELLKKTEKHSKTDKMKGT